MVTDRSRILAAQSCPRQRWLAYHIGGAGLQRKAKALPLQFGSAFHEGAEDLLMARGLATAVERAKQFLDTQFAAHAIGFDGEVPDDALKALDYGREEQIALAEALLRGWWAYEGESFLANFEVLEVEQEGRADLDDDLTLMFRPDALVRDRQSGDLYIVSWKTCATFGKRNVDQARHDMQSISECWGRMAEWDQRPISNNSAPRIEGVLYKWIVKGRRTKDDWLGIYTQDSPLIYAWMRPGPTPEEAEWSWKYRWPKEDGSGNSQLGKGFRKVPVWRDYPGGVEQWIADLASQSIAPRHINALETTFPTASPIERRQDEVESWERQVTAQEIRIATAVDSIQSCQARDGEVWADVAATIIDVYFPQFTASCHSYSGCPFLDICWGGALAQPGDIYQIREANHPEIGGDE